MVPQEMSNENREGKRPDWLLPSSRLPSYIPLDLESDGWYSPNTLGKEIVVVTVGVHEMVLWTRQRNELKWREMKRWESATLFIQSASLTGETNRLSECRKERRGKREEPGKELARVDGQFVLLSISHHQQLGKLSNASEIENRRWLQCFDDSASLDKQEKFY